MKKRKRIHVPYTPEDKLRILKQKNKNICKLIEEFDLETIVT